jgi:hypothetical protein
MQSVLGPRCRVQQLSVNRRRGETDILRVDALMASGSSWCLNRSDPAAAKYIHGDCQTFVNFYRNGICTVNDYKCLHAETGRDTSGVDYTTDQGLQAILFPDVSN